MVSLQVCLAKRRANRSTAWVRVFDNAACRSVKLLDEAPGSVEIDDVVIRQFLALKLLRRSYTERFLCAPTVERSPLMWIFAISKVHDLFKIYKDVWRKISGGTDIGQVFSDLAVVPRGTREGLPRQIE